MAFKKESLAKILVRLKIAADDAAAKDMITRAEKEDIDLVVPETVKFFSDDELATRDRTKYGEGKTAGEGMFLDGILTEQKITVPAGTKKDAAFLISAIAQKALEGANVTVDKQVKEKDKVIEGLRKNITDMEAQHATFQTQLKSKELESQLLTWTVDKKPDNLTNRQWLAILRDENELVEENGQLFVKRGGEIVKDPKLLTPIPAETALTAYITDKKLGKEVATNGQQGGGGRGAGDSKKSAAGIRTMSQYREHLKANNIDEKSAEAQTELTRITTEVKDFDFKS